MQGIIKIDKIINKFKLFYITKMSYNTINLSESITHNGSRHTQTGVEESNGNLYRVVSSQHQCQDYDQFERIVESYVIEYGFVLDSSHKDVTILHKDSDHVYLYPRVELVEVVRKQFLCKV